MLGAAERKHLTQAFIYCTNTCTKGVRDGCHHLQQRTAAAREHCPHPARKGQSPEPGRVTLVFPEQAWDDYLYWQKTDRKLVQQINDLIKEITRTPYTGTGKPEPLKHALSGYWSRRIRSEEHTSEL